MKLIDYMRQHELDDETLAAQVGSVSPHAVKKWKYGERMPRRAELDRLVQITGGAVTANDFINPLPPESDTLSEAAPSVIEQDAERCA